MLATITDGNSCGNEKLSISFLPDSRLAPGWLLCFQRAFSQPMPWLRRYRYRRWRPGREADNPGPCSKHARLSRAGRANRAPGAPYRRRRRHPGGLSGSKWPFCPFFHLKTDPLRHTLNCRMRIYMGFSTSQRCARRDCCFAAQPTGTEFWRNAGSSVQFAAGKAVLCVKQYRQ